VQSLNVVDCLKKLGASKEFKNIFKSLNNDTLVMQRMEFLLLIFNCDVLFELPLIEKLVVYSHSKLMLGMDK
jgi:hypothetical protein